MSARRAVFLDRDGTLVEERHHPVRAADLVLLPGVPEALARLGAAGWLRIVLSNQSAVARGLIDEDGLAALNADLIARIERTGGGIDAVYCCPHHPEAVVERYRVACRCRKPAPGLLEQALGERAIDVRRSAFVGDAPRDLFFVSGPAAARILVRSGHPLTDTAGADRVVDDLPAAVDWLLATG